MKRCILEICKKEIPKGRKKSAKYCSDECYYVAKKERSSTRYAIIKAPADELSRCEKILAYFYGIIELNKTILATDLKSLAFNFNISSGEHIDEKKRLFKVIGKYAYYIDASKNVTIWKSK